MINKVQPINIYFYLYLLLITVSSISSQYIFKMAHVNIRNANSLIIFGLLLYTFTGYCVYKLLNYGNLFILNIIWHLVYFIILFIIGFLVFKQKLNYQKIVALVFGLISLIIFMFYGIE